MSIYSKRNVWCAIVLYFTLIQAVIGQFHYCLKEVSYCFTITLPNDNETPVHFRLEAPSTAGWVGLGIGEGMDGYLMVAWFNNDDKSITLSQRFGEEGIQPWVDPASPNNLKLLNDASGIINDKLVVEFTRPLNVKGSNKGSKISTNDQTFAYAYSIEKPWGKEIDAYLPRHDYRGNFDGNGNGNYNKLVIAHASLMFIAWFVIIPGAIFIARFARNLLPTTWFKLHAGIQIFLSVPVILAGSTLSYIAAKGFKFDDPHKIVGFVLFLGFFMQLALGVIHHRLYNPERAHIPWWTKLHWWFGRALVVLAAFQIPLGLKLYGAEMQYFYIHYIYLFILLVAFSFLSFRLWNRREQDGNFKRMRDSSS